jgi:hypothetical protein
MDTIPPFSALLRKPSMPDFDFTTFPTLTTPRLILRQGVPDDATDVFSYNSDPEVMKYDSPKHAHARTG